MRARVLAVSGVLMAVVSAAFPLALRAQGSCDYNGTGGSCTLGGTDAIYAINLTISRAVRVALSSSSIALDAPVSDDFDAGFGQTVGPTLTVRSNSAWSVSARVTQVQWTASPAPARANKPASDLQWSRFASGPFTDFTTSNVTVENGAIATAGTVVPLYFRVRYDWLLDTPGDYSIPVQFTITAP